MTIDSGRLTSLPPDRRVKDTNAHHAGAVFVQDNHSEISPDLINVAKELLPGIVALIGWTDLTSDLLPENLDKLREFSLLKGFTHDTRYDTDNDYIVSKSFIRGIKVLKVYNYSFDIVIRHAQLPKALLLADSLPDVRLALDFRVPPIEAAGSLKDFEKLMADIASFPTVCVKICPGQDSCSGSLERNTDDIDCIEMINDLFGYKRMMYSSCMSRIWHVEKSTEAEDSLLNKISGLPDNESSAILGLTAARFYNID